MTIQTLVEKEGLPREGSDAEEESGSGRREMDQELKIMGQIVRLLEKLDAEAQGRVLHYLTLRCGSARLVNRE